MQLKVISQLVHKICATDKNTHFHCCSICSHHAHYDRNFPKLPLFTYQTTPSRARYYPPSLRYHKLPWMINIKTSSIRAFSYSIKYYLYCDVCMATQNKYQERAERTKIWSFLHLPLQGIIVWLLEQNKHKNKNGKIRSGKIVDSVFF